MAHTLAPRGPGRATLQGVSRAFKGTEVLKDVSLELEPGRIVGVLGTNGSGKTTLLRLLAGTLTPDAGNIEVCGQPANRAASAFIPPGDRALYWRLSGRADLEFFAALAGLGREEASQAAEAAAAVMQAGALLDKRIANCSTGQRRRLVLAQGLVGSAPVLLADEPFDDLDEEGRSTAARAFRAWADAGGLVVFAAPVAADGPEPDLALAIQDAKVVPI